MKELDSLKENFDVRAWLDDLGVPYSLEGDNVSAGWLGTRCVFCADHANHLGVRFSGGNRFHCWLCDEGGDAIALVRAVEGCGFTRAVNVLERYQGRDLLKEIVKAGNTDPGKVLPQEFEKIESGKEPELVRRWFQRRYFPLSLCAEWGLGWCEFGNYALHLIVPVTLDGGVVSFQAADLTGKAKSKYRSCPDAWSIRPLKHCLYGLDVAARGEQVILVEGVTDKWRLGNGAVAMFGKGWTREQMLLLWERARDKRVKVLLDLDATEDGEGLSDFLDERFPRVEYVRLEDGDPKDPGEFDGEMVRKVVSA